MFDIITFGSASQDIHVKSEKFRIIKGKEDFATGEGICLPFGSKIDVEDVIFRSGGGGTNTAVGFAKQGFRVAFCGAIGADSAGLEIVRELRQLKVDTRFLIKKKDKKTNCSVVILSKGGDRTILVYRGASELLCDKDVNLNKLKKTKWFYFAPLADSSCNILENLVDFAKEKNIKVAVNPSKQQLSSPSLSKIFSKTDILFLNQEEASFLTKITYEKESEIFKKIDELCPGVAVMTKGGEGVVVSDGKHLFSAKPDPERKVVDTTGAGDSFASGFLSAFIRYDGNIEEAIQLGLANSDANLSEIGAKTGLLSKNDEFTRVPVKKEECNQNNCIIK